MKKIRQCRSCSLCENQKPLIQKKKTKKYSVFFVGLSAVKVECVESEEPFSKDTRSGALLRRIAETNISSHIYFTNLVKCLPLKEDKIRYPINAEMKSCFSNFQIELTEYNPPRLVLFGRQVSDFLVKRLSATLNEKQPVNGVTFYSTTKLTIMSAPHPSYILVYKRKNIDWYVNTIRNFI